MLRPTSVANLFLCLHFLTLSDVAAQSAAIGVTRKGTEIPVQLPIRIGRPGSYSGEFRVVIIGGHDGEKSLIDDASEFWRELEAKLAETPLAEQNPRLFLSVIPNVYLDGLPEGMPAEEAVRSYPPKDGFYDHKTHPESRYLWRWVAMYGPDLIIDVRTGKPGLFFVGQMGEDELTRQALRKHLPLEKITLAQDDFARQAADVSLADLGTAPAAVLQLPAATLRPQIIESLTPIIRAVARRRSSPANLSLALRSKKQDDLIAFGLTQSYGKDLKQVAYIPALAVIGRLQMVENATTSAGQQPGNKAWRAYFEREILTDQLLGPYLSSKLSPVPKSGSEQAGHLVFAELAKRSEGKDRERWIELCRAAADQIFDKDGKPLKLMPYHNEMSDAVFMATPIICATGKLTGEQKYFDAAVTHFRSMKKLCLREDGIYRHSPLDEAAWGRGNGFPAMGLAWALSEFPEDHAAFPELKKDFQSHIAALLKHQDAFGCWHQVIDKPGSYREFSATAMIAWAIKRGMDRGWLDKATHQPALDRAWVAVKQRIGPKGVIVDICTGTGKQKSLRDYYDRPAIWGVDARGGAMALMLATEMMDAK